MKRLEEIDRNFAIKDLTVKAGTITYNGCEPPFSVHGVFLPTESHNCFHRMDPSISPLVNPGVNELNDHCAGGRIRFATNSSYIAVTAVLTKVSKMPHFTMTGTAGFDLYSDKSHIATFQPKFDISDRLFGEYSNTERTMREYTLDLPLYSGLKEIYITLDEDALLQSAKTYKNDKPVVFYGSSITQGGCASRPGTSYPAILSRALNLDYINLGFSGSAKGESVMAEYIAGLDMSAFVLDYDHNAPSADHLNQTHENFFKTVRKAHPDIPVICLSRPTPFDIEVKERAAIIENTVLHARLNGDRNVYFINMSDYLAKKGILNEATVDKIHSNDLGFYFMAEAVIEIVKNLL